MIKYVSHKVCHIYFNPSLERAKKNDLNAVPKEVFFLYKCPMQINGSIRDKTLWTDHGHAKNSLDCDPKTHLYNCKQI